MRYTKNQKEVIAYALALLIDECEIKSTKNDMMQIITDLQNEKIFGYVDFYKD